MKRLEKLKRDDPEAFEEEMKKRAEAGLIAEADKLVPEEYKAQYEEAKRLRAMKDDPEALKAELQAKAESYIPGQYKAGFGMAKGLYADPRSVKGFVPEGYEKYADMGEGMLDKAAELKK